MAATGTCTYLAAKELNLWFNGAGYSFPGTGYIEQDTGTSTGAGAAFPVTSGNGYARLATTFNTTNYPTISATNVMASSGTFSYATATGAWTGNSGANTLCKNGVYYDALTTGNALFFGPNGTNETVVANDVLQYTAISITLN